MTTKEEASFRAVYEKWPNDRLARAVTLERKDYLPEAVALMLEELKKRGVAEERISEVVVPLPPPAPLPERDTFFLPARLNRKQYSVRFFLWLVVVIGGAVVLESISALQSGVATLIFIFTGCIYKLIAIDIPRMKNAGLISPLFILLLLIPIANLVFTVLLFAIPPKK